MIGKRRGSAKEKMREVRGQMGEGMGYAKAVTTGGS